MLNSKKQMDSGLMQIYSRLTFFILFLTLTMFLFVGCSVSSAPPLKQEKIESRRFGVHVVKFEKESPSLVSAWYTDSPKNWVQFFVLKKSKSKNSYLPIGSEVFIPVKLMKSNETMPQSFVIDWRKKNGEPKNSFQKQMQSSADRSLKSEEQTEENSVESIDNDQLIENLVGVE